MPDTRPPHPSQPIAAPTAEPPREPLALARRLITLDTRGGNEKPAATLLATLLDDAGFAVRLDEPEPGRANLVARYGTGTPLTLTGHLDTVPADPAGWSFDPLSGHVHGDRLRGRGSSDMKAGVAALVCAALDHVAGAGTAKEAGSAGVRGAALQLVFTFGEETGCDGARHLTDLAPSPALLVAEPTGNRLVLGHKGALWLRLTAHGRSAHGSRPELGENALVALAATATRLHTHDAWPVSPTHGPVTVNPGAFRAGVQPNLVPDHAELDLDIRTVPGFGTEDALAKVGALAAPGTRIERLLDLPSIATDPSAPLVARLAAALHGTAAGASGADGHGGHDGRVPAADYATYFTDASVLAGKLGSPAVLLHGPGDPEQAHTTDETCSVDKLLAATDAYRRLLTAWRQEPAA
ncbi:M20 family metallopeptidase [Streptomyces diacarni]|uniref:M20 family peptidase n=1 Tax=Streptomyces diacarni TaxID=2800381 RepID=A0A367F7N6_9ACTN|nr:M20 family metallopeptidase [Streptomyces diacarni]RCG26376.1 M20 family peptidase [Streptomyces diacarni]